MRLGLALALGLTLCTTAVWVWRSGHARGVSFVQSETLSAKWNSGFQGLSGYDRAGIRRAYLTDRGSLFFTSHEGLTQVTLQSEDGTAYDWKQWDSEGLAILPDRRFAVSFEGDHRVEIFGADGTSQERLPVPEGFAAFTGNDGLEALAVSPEGALLTLPERSGAVARDFPLFVYDGTWRQTTLPRRGKFLPVGADFGPDGRLYLLERDYLASGFRSRIRRFIWDGATLSAEEELLKTRFWRHGNLEGIAVFEERGETFIEMISDNNFLPLQRSELVRYRLKTP